MVEESMPNSDSSAENKKKVPGVKKSTASKKNKKATAISAGVPTAKAAVKPAASKSTRSVKSKTVLKNQKSRPGGTTRKKTDMKEILFRKFEKWVPKELFRAESTRKASEGGDSRSSVSGKDEHEAARIRKLLFKKFDLGTSEPEASESAGFSSRPSPSATETPPFAKPEIPKTRTSDPMAITLKLMLIGFALLMALVIKVSASNRSNYYIRPADSGVEIWRGIFAPMGSERLLNLTYAEPPASVRSSYTKEEVSRYVYDHYVQRADELLQGRGTPDLELVKSYLAAATPYSLTDAQRGLIRSRLNSIDRLVLIIKADAAAAKSTLADYEAALTYLKQAQTLDAGGTESSLIRQKIEAVDSAIAAIKKEQAVVQKPASPSR